jgi:hypothetical protein
MKPPFYTRYVILLAVCGIIGFGIVFQMIRINYSIRELSGQPGNGLPTPRRHL